MVGQLRPQLIRSRGRPTNGETVPKASARAAAHEQAHPFRWSPHHRTNFDTIEGLGYHSLIGNTSRAPALTASRYPTFPTRFVPSGRWLGGRPNYGYRIVDTDLPHPQRQKAAAGIRLRVLEPDPDTAPIVHRIFEMFDNRIGYRTIATILEREGIPSPGEVGPTRHPRSAGVWSGSAVRAILVNPRYLGHQVVGRQRRRDELVEPTNPAAGTASKQRWQASDQWVTSDEPAWPTLVERDLWERVNARVRNDRDPHRRPPRAKPGVYVLADLIRCSVCGRSMHGATMKGKAYYRCNRQRPDYAETGRPRSTTIRDERILTALDTWLNRLTDAEHRASTLATVLSAEADPEPEHPRGPSCEARCARAARRARPRARRRPRRHGPHSRDRHNEADPTRARRRPQHGRRLECRRR